MTMRSKSSPHPIVANVIASVVPILLFRPAGLLGKLRVEKA